MGIIDTDALKKQGYICMEKWGGDHWSLLGYLGTLAPDQKDISPPRLRDKRSSNWRPEYGTRLKGYFENKSSPDLLLKDHDDWDCLHDMEAEGLVVRATGTSMTFGFTPKGYDFVAALNRFKSEGGQFAGFGDSELYKEVKNRCNCS